MCVTTFSLANIKFLLLTWLSLLLVIYSENVLEKVLNTIFLMQWRWRIAFFKRDIPFFRLSLTQAARTVGHASHLYKDGDGTYRVVCACGKIGQGRKIVG